MQFPTLIFIAVLSFEDICIALNLLNTSKSIRKRKQIINKLIKKTRKRKEKLKEKRKKMERKKNTKNKKKEKKKKTRVRGAMFRTSNCTYLDNRFGVSTYCYFGTRSVHSPKRAGGS